MEEGGVIALAVGRAGCVGRADVDGVVEGVERKGRRREDRSDGFRETGFQEEGKEEEKERCCSPWKCGHGALDGQKKKKKRKDNNS